MHYTVLDVKFSWHHVNNAACFSVEDSDLSVVAEPELLGQQNDIRFCLCWLLAIANHDPLDTDQLLLQKEHILIGLNNLLVEPLRQ